MRTSGIPQLQTVNPRSLRQEVAAVLSQAICLARIPPGQRLVEAELAKNMRVGRVAVREAIGQLERQGLVTITPNKGARCIDPSWEECLEALALRMKLETWAVRLVAARQDKENLRAMADLLHEFSHLCDDPNVEDVDLWERWREAELIFHGKLIAASGSKVLAKMWDIVGPFLWATIQYGRQKNGKAFSPALDEREKTRIEVERHRMLLNAIATTNMDAAEAAMRTHHENLFQDAEMDPLVLEALRWGDYTPVSTQGQVGATTSSEGQ